MTNLAFKPVSPSKSGSGPTDAALVIAARGGEAWAQQALFERYARLVLGLSHRILPHPADAEDLAQDVFVHALNRLDSLQNPQAFASWISSIVVRTASKRLRTRRLLVRLGLRRDQPVDLESIVASGAPPEAAIELRAVYSVLHRLPAQERVAIVLRRVEGLELTEVAEQMGLSLATVKRRLARAEARLLKLRPESAAPGVSRVMP
ncbi:MAG TPA: sigma-70 family RNA polymerase sigma factor [Polyangiaceae bacterium]|nr:sigma-70 family RNA polymerase sigma factor [Polyangiaceae bacterium]